MAGIKGRSGGARVNSGGPRPNAGGKRPGAGRKALVLDIGRHDDPLSFLEALMRCETAPIRLRDRAAKALLPYRHRRLRAYRQNE